MAFAEQDAPAPEVGDLYRRYSSWLKVQVRRHGLGEADDDVQETYLHLASAPLHGGIRHPQALLLRIAQNIMRNAARSAQASKRTPGSVPDFVFRHELAPDQFEAALWRETVEAMPETFRDTFLMSRVRGMSNDQIAKACNLSVKTVEWRLAKALAFCAARIRD